MTLEEFEAEKKRCSLILADICALEDNQDDVKGLFLKLFDLYRMGVKAHSSLFSVGGMKATLYIKC